MKVHQVQLLHLFLSSSRAWFLELRSLAVARWRRFGSLSGCSGRPSLSCQCRHDWGRWSVGGEVNEIVVAKTVPEVKIDLAVFHVFKVRPEVAVEERIVAKGAPGKV